MTGPHPAGEPWTVEDDRALIRMVADKMDRRVIARKLRRTLSAVHTRLGKLRKAARQSGEAQKLFG